MTWFNHSFEAFAFALLSIIFEGIPFLLLGSLISGFVDVYVSSERVIKMLPKNPILGAFAAGLMGLIFPICECGSVVVVRRFLRKGLPIGSAVAYMLAAPIVSPVVAISTYKAFTGQSPELMVMLRLGMGFVIAFGVALVFQKLPKNRILKDSLADSGPKFRRTGLQTSITSSQEISDTPAEPDFSTLVSKASPGKKFLLAIQSATADFLDVTVFFIIGASLASLFIGFKEASMMGITEAPFLSIIALMGLASLLCLCSTTDAFIAANAFGQFSLAAKLGFLTFGPMFDFKLFWLYSMIFKKRVVTMLGIGLFLIVSFICWRIDLVEKSRNPAAQVQTPVAETQESSPLTKPLSLELPKQ